jgi:hypothetical protein
VRYEIEWPGLSSEEMAEGFRWGPQ